MRRRLTAALILGALTGYGCSREQWGFPRVPLRATSPDGRFVAFVKNHPSIDPSNQTLWIQPPAGDAIKVAAVPPDAFWCDRIVWSADSRRVAFVIADAIVQAYDVESSALVFSGFVGRRSWDTPPRYILRDVSLSADGRQITFRECERTWHKVDAARQNARGTRVESSVANCSDGSHTVAFSAVAASHLW